MDLTAWLLSTAAMLPVMLWVGFLCFDDDPTNAEMESLLVSRGPCFTRQDDPLPQPRSNTALAAFSITDFPLFQNRGPTP